MISLSAASSQLLLQAPQLALLLIPSQPRQISESCFLARRDCRAGWKTLFPGRMLIAGLGELADAPWWGHGAGESLVPEIQSCPRRHVLPSMSDPPFTTGDQEWGKGDLEKGGSAFLGRAGPQTIVYDSVATCATEPRAKLQRRSSRHRQLASPLCSQGGERPRAGTCRGNSVPPTLALDSGTCILTVLSTCRLDP